MSPRAARTISIDYTPTERQRLLHTCGARQIFYGGAAGGGKSHALRTGEALLLCLANPGLQAYLFRKILDELEDNHLVHIRAWPREFGIYHETKKRFQFANGAVLHCGYAEREADIWSYRGREMHLVLVDEASQFTTLQLNVLRAWNRIGGWAPAPGYEHVFPRIVLGSNPGGPSHTWLKRTFIAPAPPETIFYDEVMRDPKNPADLGWTTCFLPAKMADNPHIDRGYAASFGAFAPEMRKALVEGDWDAVVGAALDRLSAEKHKVRTFTPPRHWTRLMSIDWGTARPFSVGWWAISEGALLEAKPGWPAVWLPPGAMVRYREFYGWTGEENKGLRLSAPEVARRILEIERDAQEPYIDVRVGDSQMWAQTDGPSPAENFALVGVALSPSKKDRRIAYAEFLARIAGSPTFMQDGQEGEAPMLFATEACAHFWRTLPSLTLDEIEPDKGPDTKQEDHVYDECVYAMRTRPFVTTAVDRWEADIAAARAELAAADGRGRDPYASAR